MYQIKINSPLEKLSNSSLYSSMITASSIYNKCKKELKRRELLIPKLTRTNDLDLYNICMNSQSVREVVEKTYPSRKRYGGCDYQRIYKFIAKYNIKHLMS